MGITVHLKLIEMAKLEGEVQRVERLGSYTVLTSSINMASWKQAFYKRAMDIVGGLIGCIITGILYLIVAPCIYIKSPGPIFFSQVRVGKNGKRFKLYKFRSMYMDAEKRKKELMAQNRVKDGMMFKLDHDPRIIGGDKGIGGFIRKYSIDEFPQFWNVLKGDMSLVGTRPPTIDEWDKYELHHRVRLAIKPGITGMWQVSGRSDITDFEEVVRLDKAYITNWSLGLDMKIVMRTVGVVFGKSGAM
jgi:lipopolysaccharide/colanic/teichoic acid biosynthesis glycosyltransferase